MCSQKLKLKIKIAFRILKLIRILWTFKFIPAVSAAILMDDDLIQPTISAQDA